MGHAEEKSNQQAGSSDQSGVKPKLIDVNHRALYMIKNVVNRELLAKTQHQLTIFFSLLEPSCFHASSRHPTN